MFLCTWKEFLEDKTEIYKKWGIDNCIFIRPNSGDKLFPAQILPYDSNKQFEEALYRIKLYDIQDNDLCLISTPKNIKTEWRFFVTANGVITGANFKNTYGTVTPVAIDETTILGQLAISYANIFVRATEYIPNKVWVMDICELQNGKFKVVELNAFSCSGIYSGCDVTKIIEVVDLL